jgi:hypothetical protein
VLWGGHWLLVHMEGWNKQASIMRSWGWANNWE